MQLSSEYRSPASSATDHQQAVLRGNATAGVGKLQRMAESTADVLGLDWSTDMAEARAVLGPDRVLQGNMDPAVLFASEVSPLPPTYLCLRLHRKQPRQLLCTYLCTCMKASQWEVKGPLRGKSTCPEQSCIVRVSLMMACSCWHRSKNHCQLFWADQVLAQCLALA